LEISGDIEKALADINAAINLSPQFGDAYRSRTRLLLEKDDFEGAIIDSTEAIRLRSRGAYKIRAEAKEHLVGNQREIEIDHMHAALEAEAAVMAWSPPDHGLKKPQEKRQHED
jgi:tetratricopeptide (TPR) repeat protein